LVLLEDCVVDAPWFRFDVAPELLVVWFADTPLVTSWLPLPTCTPGLMLAPALTDEFAMPTFASTPTFGFTLVVRLLLDGEVLLEGEVLLDELLGEELVPEVVDWFVLAPWFIVEVEPMSVADWFALTPLVTDWLPLPMFTPGLTLAPRFTSVLLIPTFASTPTFGFTLSEELLVLEGAELELGVGEVKLLGPPVGADEVEPMPEPLALPVLEPLALPELVAPEVPLLRVLVPVVPVRSLPPEAAELLVVPPAPAAFVPKVPERSLPLALGLPMAPFMAPLVVGVEAPVVLDEVEAVVSSQSICTGLEECSFASPVRLSASLPALGFLNELQSGFAILSSRSLSPRMRSP
jgi:hypothetical protein